ncbi:hypothetical protein H8959_002561 [Pygathrix nigripes]
MRHYHKLWYVLERGRLWSREATTQACPGLVFTCAREDLSDFGHGRGIAGVSWRGLEKVPGARYGRPELPVLALTATRHLTWGRSTFPH